MFDVFALILSLFITTAQAQNVTCATRPPGDYSNACASTAFVTSAVPSSSINPPVNGVYSTGPVTWTAGEPSQVGGPQAIITGAIAGTALTVSTITSGTVAIGQSLQGDGVVPNTYIVSGSGTSWVVSPSQTTSSVSMTAYGGYSCFGASCTNSTAYNKFVTGISGGALVSRPLATLTLSYDGTRILGLPGGDIPPNVILPYQAIIASDGNGPACLQLSNTYAGPNAKTWFMCANGAPGSPNSDNLTIGANFDAFINGVQLPQWFLTVNRAGGGYAAPGPLVTNANFTVPVTSRSLPATGQFITDGTRPANGSTIVINGVTFTFVTGTPSGAQVQIASDLNGTLINLVNTLNASANANVSKAAYSTDGFTTVIVSFKQTGSTGNSFTISAGGTTHLTASAATLSGGGNPAFTSTGDVQITTTGDGTGGNLSVAGVGAFTGYISASTAYITNTMRANSVEAYGATSQIQIDRRDNNAQAAAIYSGSGDVNFYLNAIGGNAFSIATSGNVSFYNSASANLFVGKTLYSAAGTPLPSCGGGASGTIAVVSDATAPTYRGNYVSGGAVVTPVFCDGSGTWKTQ